MGVVEVGDLVREVQTFNNPCPKPRIACGGMDITRHFGTARSVLAGAVLGDGSENCMDQLGTTSGSTGPP